MKNWSISDKKRVRDWLVSQEGQRFQHQQWRQEEEESLAATPAQFRFVKASNIDSHAGVRGIV